MSFVTTLPDSKLYRIGDNSGYSCLGFDVLESRYTRLASEMVAKCGYSVPQPEIYGTPERYQQYKGLLAAAQRYSADTGYRFHSELTRELIGLEGRRVEVTYQDGTKSRFKVGKSTGWLPCHLELKNVRSMGGSPVYFPSGSSVRVIR